MSSYYLVGVKQCQLYHLMELILSAMLMMDRNKYLGILNSIKEQPRIANPGILPKGKSVESQVEHTFINLSDVTLTSDQVSALEKGLTFCPTPGPPIRHGSGQTFTEDSVSNTVFIKDNGQFDSLTEVKSELMDFLASNLE